MKTEGSPARSLHATRIIRSLSELKARIAERFPERGLVRVCGELVDVAQETAARVKAARRPNVLIRAATYAIVALALSGAIWLAEIGGAFDQVAGSMASASAIDLMQAVEAGVNLLILAALACWFFVSLEARLSRRGVLRHLHELRSLAHVVDMHQLTKDPVSILNPGLRLPGSPVRDMTPGELARYLDYCVEMLSLIGKLAALYAEYSEDAQVIDASNDVEELTTNLSRKIWQKIMVTGSAGELSPD